ncbi:MerR family DNA-binding transcriptional regulator [Nonomuraea sp. NPDC050202]|uniref:helix-turn-helix domain-containing protein n=1 Tax=Nonomuraea sp. NPDC050202 TaxID=3155035 RepID=UPI0033FF5A82
MALAAALNAAGHRTGTGQPFDGVAAANLRHYHHIPYPGLLHDGELTPRQVATRVGVSIGTIHYWINAGYLPAPRGPANRWAIPFPPEVEAACIDRASGSAHQHRDQDHHPRQPHELSVTEVAHRLGVKPDVVYHWTQWGHLPARRGLAGRLWNNFTPAVEETCLQKIASSPKLPADVKAQTQQRRQALSGAVIRVRAAYRFQSLEQNAEAGPAALRLLWRWQVGDRAHQEWFVQQVGGERHGG